MELPIFEGEDAPSWIERIERYFCPRNINEQEKMEVVLVAMEGEALSWLQWWDSCTKNLTWKEFKEAILKRSQPTMVENSFEILLGINQEGTVREYRRQFEVLVGPLKINQPKYMSGILSMVSMRRFEQR
uniref:Retrotransposon gag domain-containing protein n=1 Tax=Cajanus cajan TaxID=3821 RepID=A0A151TEB3_CAJCA|nr:hypothetical protein KK1_011600 [Cajanus cajan]